MSDVLKIGDGFDGEKVDLNSAVKFMQSNLNKLGYNLKDDGDFGKLTEDVVKDFQSKNGLEPTGIFNEATNKVLQENIQKLNPAPDVAQDNQALEKTQSTLQQTSPAENPYRIGPDMPESVSQMPPKTSEPQISVNEQPEKKGFLGRAGDWLEKAAENVAEVVTDVVSITPPAILVKYWAENWRNLPQALGIKDSDAKDHNIKLTDTELQQAEGRVHEEFKYITFISKYHGKAEDLNNLNEKEKEYIGDKFKKEEVVGFIEDEKTGLRAAAIKDAEGKINIVIAGGDLKNGFKPLKKDIDDVFLSTAGDETTQLEPLLNFAREMKEKHGSVDKITGHSLGGHLAFGLVPEFPNAQVTTFDAPGMSDAYAHDLAQRYNKTPDDIKKSFDKDVYRIRVNDNAYNTLGWSPVDVTMGEKASLAIDDHFMGDGKNGKGYEAKVMALGSKVGNEKADLQNDDITNNNSIGPIGISGLMVAATVPLVAGSAVVAGATVVAGTSAIIKKGMNEPNGFTTKESEFYDRVKEELSADGKLDREDKRLLKDIKAQLSESGVQYDKMEGLADRVVARVAAGVKPEQEATKGIK